jgi:hypothetical protein
MLSSFPLKNVPIKIKYYQKSISFVEKNIL